MGNEIITKLLIHYCLLIHYFYEEEF